MRTNKLLYACLTALLLIAWGASALAKVPSPSKEFYYLDQANVLSEATKGEIFFANQLLEDACGAQIVVAAVKTTGSEDISNYAYEMINQWGIGSSDTQNGFLLVLAIDDDDYYAVPGTGLQPRFTSSAIKEYYDKYLEKDFAARNYDAGVKKFFEAVFTRVADTYNANVSVDDGIAAYRAWVASGDSASWGTQTSGRSMTEGDYTDDGMDFEMIVALIVMVVLVIILLRLMTRRRRMAQRRNVFVSPPPPPQEPFVGQGGYRGVNNMPGAGGYRGPVQTSRQVERSDDGFFAGWLMGMLSSSGRSGGYRSSGRSRSHSSGSFFRSSGPSRSSGSSRSFGSARGGGGGSRGGGAGRGRH